MPHLLAINERVYLTRMFSRGNIIHYYTPCFLWPRFLIRFLSSMVLIKELTKLWHGWANILHAYFFSHHTFIMNRTYQHYLIKFFGHLVHLGKSILWKKIVIMWSCISYNKMIYNSCISNVCSHLDIMTYIVMIWWHGVPYCTINYAQCLSWIDTGCGYSHNAYLFAAMNCNASMA